MSDIKFSGFRVFMQKQNEQLMETVRNDKVMKKMTRRERRIFIKYNPNFHGVDFNPRISQRNLTRFFI